MLLYWSLSTYWITQWNLHYVQKCTWRGVFQCVLYFWWHLTLLIFQKSAAVCSIQTFSIWCGLTDSFNLKKNKQKKTNHLSPDHICCLLTLKEPVHSTKASSQGSSCVSSRCSSSNHLVMHSSLLKELLTFIVVYKYKKTPFLLSCGARHPSLLVQCVASAVSSFQPS